MTVDVLADRDRAFRDTLGRWATGVSVMTVAGPTGLTVNAFTSLSLRPPLVLWCLRRASRRRDIFCRAAYFAVNVLAVGQDDLAAAFATPGTGWQPRIAWRAGPHGLPVLEGTTATLLCRRTRLIPGGDHVIVIGHVEECTHGDRAPLLFIDGRLHPGAGSDQRTRGAS